MNILKQENEQVPVTLSHLKTDKLNITLGRCFQTKIEKKALSRNLN